MNMKNLIIVASILAIAMIAVFVAFNPLNTPNSQDNTLNSSNQGTDFIWYTDLDSAMNEAKKTNKSIFVLFSASWCPACQQLESETLSDPEVQEKLAQNYISVKIDVDSNPDLSSQYGIMGIPAIIILDVNGNQIQKLVGYRSPEELIGAL